MGCEGDMTGLQQVSCGVLYHCQAGEFISLCEASMTYDKILTRNQHFRHTQGYNTKFFSISLVNMPQQRCIADLRKTCMLRQPNFEALL